MDLILCDDNVILDNTITLTVSSHHDSLLISFIYDQITNMDIVQLFL